MSFEYNNQVNLLKQLEHKRIDYFLLNPQLDKATVDATVTCTPEAREIIECMISLTLLA